MQKTVIVIHYHELWLKGRNRKFFLGKFLLGLRRAFADFPSMRMRQPGDRVVLNGSGIGERHHGGLAERARVDGGSLVRVPDALTSEQAAAIGTAGWDLIDNGLMGLPPFVIM